MIASNTVAWMRLMTLESLRNLDDASEGHKSFFDCGTVAKIYISHVLVLEVWEGGRYTQPHIDTHTRPVFTPCVWRQEDKAPQCQPQFLWCKCIRIDGAFHQMLLWRTWFVYLMKNMSVWICVLELETVAGVGGRFSWDRGTELTNSIYIILVREDWPLFG